MTNPFERRLAKLEAERAPSTEGDGVRIVFIRAPDGMTDMAEQDAWAATQPHAPGALVVRFVNCPPQPPDAPSVRLH